MQTQERTYEENTFEYNIRRKPRRKKGNFFFRLLKGLFLSLLALCLTGAAAVGIVYWLSLWPSTINMSSTCDNMKHMNVLQMDGMSMTGDDAMCQGAHASDPVTPMQSLSAPDTASHVATFTLTARQTLTPLGNGEKVKAFTINGITPGPTLHARQGDLVVIHVVNQTPVGIAIHWHGIRVPNSADGVAGLTQDAIKPGASYTYRFIAKDPGTYWYHSHEHSWDQTEQGLYGMIVIDPTTPAPHDDVDQVIALHEWTFGDFRNFRYVQLVNGTAQQTHIAARPGDWVRLRITNTSSNPKLVAVTGAPYTVVAIDGHDLNGPTPLQNAPLPIGTGQRYDIRFQMPASGAVALFRAPNLTASRILEKQPAVVVGQATAAITAPAANMKWFDFSHYGTPASTSITPQSHFDATYTLTLGGHFGFMNGRFGPEHTINGATFPNTPTIVVQSGQLVRLRFVNETNEYHPMHLHGHIFTILSRNGKPLTGSPVYVDTVLVQPHETYEVGFLADNPGLWMEHCHNLFHAYMGMDMMIVYPNISTPYNTGSDSGNFPD